MNLGGISKMVTRVFSVIGVLFLLAACSVVTPTLTVAPTIPPTPVESKVWEAPPVLLEFYNAYPSTFSSKLVLYTNGQMIVSHIYMPDYDSNNDPTPQTPNYLIVTAQLSHPELCEFLQQFETYGFLEPHALEHRTSQSTDQLTTILNLNSWKTLDLEAYGLDLTDPETSPAIVKTVNWLNDYLPPHASAYQPERIVLQVSQWNAGPNDTVSNWQFSDLDLAAIANSETQAISVEGTEAQEIYNQVDIDLGKPFREKGITYWISVAPIMPLQNWDPATERYPRPYAYMRAPLRTMDCTGM